MANQKPARRRRRIPGAKATVYVGNDGRCKTHLIANVDGRGTSKGHTHLSICITAITKPKYDFQPQAQAFCPTAPDAEKI